MTGLSFILLLAVAAMVPPASAQGGISNCCLRIAGTNPRKELLVEYYIQRPPTCRVHSVVFITKEKKRICSDPNKQSTKTRMAYLDKRNWKRLDLLATPGT